MAQEVTLRLLAERVSELEGRVEKAEVAMRWNASACPACRQSTFRVLHTTREETLAGVTLVTRHWECALCGAAETENVR